MPGHPLSCSTASCRGAATDDLLRLKPAVTLWTLTAPLRLVAFGLVLIAFGLPGAGVWLVLYGGGNGIYSIARGTVPLALFGPVRYPLVVGRLALPGLVAQALAPPTGAFVLTHASPDALWRLLLALSLANLGLVGALWRLHRTYPSGIP